MNNSEKYRDMVTLIFDNNLKYFAWKHYGKQLGDELRSDTVTYFLDKYSTYKHNNHNQLLANSISKIKNILKDKIRKENATGLFGKIIDSGDYLSLEKDDIISIKEIKNINEDLKKDKLKPIQFQSIILNVALRDDEDEATKEISYQTNISKTKDQEQHQELLLAFKILDKLEDKCRDITKSKLLEGLSYKEIQNKFNIKSIGTVMSRLSRCMESLTILKEKELNNA